MSDLYKMSRLMNLEQLGARVKAAMLQQAATMDLTPPLSRDANFAVWVLKNPSVDEPSMQALVAADPAVLAAATMAGDALANVDDVPDADIRRVVAARWSLVAAKYPTS